jgi:hypothetical protein
MGFSDAAVVAFWKSMFIDRYTPLLQTTRCKKIASIKQHMALQGFVIILPTCYNIIVTSIETAHGIAMVCNHLADFMPPKRRIWKAGHCYKGLVAELPPKLRPFFNGRRELCSVNWGRLRSPRACPNRVCLQLHQPATVFPRDPSVRSK